MANYFALIILLSPILFSLTALSVRLGHGKHILLVKRGIILCCMLSLITSALCAIITFKEGYLEFAPFAVNGFGFSVRLDAITAIMLVMIALLAFIIVRFSLNYLDGDEKQGVFLGRLAATLASIHLLVMSANVGLLFLSWVLTSISLQRLLLFYPERPGAIIASKKKFVVARAGDCCLLIAFIFLYAITGSGNLQVIFGQVNVISSFNATLEVAALFIVFAALLKSAQFPTHGWLIEIMETPTPVSALLHAGLLNAGPFLIIRMAFVMDHTSIAPLVLILIAGCTALFGSIAYLTQTSIKTALSYSSVAHMGFSLMLGGLGVYPAAMLHLVAHSFYKAHAFLSSGSVIDAMRTSKVKTTPHAGNTLHIVVGVVAAIGVFVICSLGFSLSAQEQLSLLVVGIVIILGLTRLFTATLDMQGPKIVSLIILIGIFITTSFLSLESGTRNIIASQVPDFTSLTLPEIILTGLLLTAFTAVVFIQISLPRLSEKRYYNALAIHFRNGLYANAIFDKMIGALQITSPRLLREEQSTTRSTQVASTNIEIEEHVAG